MTSKDEIINFIFENNKSFSLVGNKDEYKSFLDTIFPKSKCKDFYFHGTNCELEEFEIKGREGFLVDNIESAKKWALIRVESRGGNPFVYVFKVNMTDENEVYYDNADEFDPEGTMNIIFEKESDVYMLGNKKDLLNFTDFIKSLSSPSDISPSDLH